MWANREADNDEHGPGNGERAATNTRHARARYCDELYCAALTLSEEQKLASWDLKLSVPAHFRPLYVIEWWPLFRGYEVIQKQWDFNPGFGKRPL